MKDKIISRRSFFKTAATAALPIIAAITMPALLSSCEIDEPYLEEGGGSSTGCTTCKGGCGGGCTSNCGVSCGGACKGSCGGNCSYGCGNTCRGACTKSNKF